MPPVKLTEPEMIIIRYICKGHSNKEIARYLGNSVSTINNHVVNIYNKFGIHSIRKLIYEVYRAGLVKPPEVEKW